MMRIRSIILDGAMGTELARRGVDTGLPLWSANALQAAPDVVRQIHVDHLRAGAQVITANTFRTNVRTLDRAGLSGLSRYLTALAVRLAREAARQVDHPSSVRVAGSMAPVEDCYSPWLVPPDSALVSEHAELARHLAETGCDLILVETMNTIREAVIAAQAAAATGLPVWVSFTLNSQGDLLSGERLAEAVQAVQPVQPEAVLVNCIPVAQVSSALADLRMALSGSTTAFGAYANAGCLTESGWTMDGGIGPREYGRAAVAWVRQGATVVGGCCGTTPEHIAEIARRLRPPPQSCQSPPEQVN